MKRKSTKKFGEICRVLTRDAHCLTNSELTRDPIVYQKRQQSISPIAWHHRMLACCS